MYNYEKVLKDCGINNPNALLESYNKLNIILNKSFQEKTPSSLFNQDFLGESYKFLGLLEKVKATQLKCVADKTGLGTSLQAYSKDLDVNSEMIGAIDHMLDVYVPFLLKLKDKLFEVVNQYKNMEGINKLNKLLNKTINVLYDNNTKTTTYKNDYTDYNPYENIIEKNTNKKSETDVTVEKTFWTGKNIALLSIFGVFLLALLIYLFKTNYSSSNTAKK
jgi:hypothetical protein